MSDTRVFTTRTPSHLIAATAAAMADPAPVIRERHTINRAMEHLVTLTPVHPTAPATPRAPTPLDVRRTAVTQAVHRIARTPPTATDLRVQAARSRTALRHQAVRVVHTGRPRTQSGSQPADLGSPPLIQVPRQRDEAHPCPMPPSSTRPPR